MLSPAAPISFDSLTGLDWFLVIVAALSTLFAFRRGFIRVLFSVAGWIVGTLLAGWNYARLTEWLGRWIMAPLAAQAVAFLAILIAVTIVFSMLAGLVRRTAKAIGLGFADRLLGAALGLVRGVLIGVAAMMALTAFDSHASWLRHSVLAPYYVDAAHAVSFVVPPRFQQQMAEGAKHLVENTPVVPRRKTQPQ